MNVGFDSQNLNAAVALVMELASNRNQGSIWHPGSGVKQYLLSDADQVREYLMSRAEYAYARATHGVVAQIRDVVYFSVGVVFEENKGEMHPPPVSRTAERPIHLAYFWQVLGA